MSIVIIVPWVPIAKLTRPSYLLPCADSRYLEINMVKSTYPLKVIVFVSQPKL